MRVGQQYINRETKKRYTVQNLAEGRFHCYEMYHNAEYGTYEIMTDRDYVIEPHQTGEYDQTEDWFFPHLVSDGRKL